MKKWTACAALILSCMIFLVGYMSTDASAPASASIDREQGNHTAYIAKLTEQGGRTLLTADYIQWYEGAKADQVFKEREKDAEDMDGPPDGYYIVNDSPKLRTLEVADDAVVLMQYYLHAGQTDQGDIVWNERISLEKFKELLADRSQLDLTGFPYHLTVKDGKVVKIVQQYLP